MTKIYDEVCGWPYSEPYGMVAAPKVKKPRSKRKSRAKADWLKQPKKEKRTHGTPDQLRLPEGWKFVVEAPSPIRQTPLLEAPPQGFAEAFIRGAFAED